MKLTDMAVLFEVFFICLVVAIHLKECKEQANLMNQIMYNNVMDIVTEDALRAGFYTVDRNGVPLVDLEELCECFIAEVGLYENFGRHILIYVESDGIYSCDTYSEYKWSEKSIFSSGVSTEHEEKVSMISDYLEDKYGVITMIPTNNGETWQNTIKDYSLLCISYDMNTDICCFSGAVIEKQ